MAIIAGKDIQCKKYLLAHVVMGNAERQAHALGIHIIQSVERGGRRKTIGTIAKEKKHIISHELTSMGQRSVGSALRSNTRGVELNSTGSGAGSPSQPCTVEVRKNACTKAPYKLRFWG